MDDWEVLSQQVARLNEQWRKHTTPWMVEDSESVRLAFPLQQFTQLWQQRVNAERQWLEAASRIYGSPDPW